jgi:cobyrinic acid a,c-diamide synthase
MKFFKDVALSTVFAGGVTVLVGFTSSLALVFQAAQATGADICIAEGSMGLYDGVALPGASGTGASAEVAARMGWPVVLVTYGYNHGKPVQEVDADG